MYPYRGRGQADRGSQCSWEPIPRSGQHGGRGDDGRGQRYNYRWDRQGQMEILLCFFDKFALNFGLNYSQSTLVLLQLWDQAACLHPRSPLLGILVPLRSQREVIRHVLVSKEQVPVAPDAGGESREEHQVRDMGVLSVQLLGGTHCEHPVQPRACRDGHQLVVDIVLVVIREREAAVRNKV